jgi:hypothetical protein
MLQSRPSLVFQPSTKTSFRAYGQIGSSTLFYCCSRCCFFHATLLGSSESLTSLPLCLIGDVYYFFLLILVIVGHTCRLPTTLHRNCKSTTYPIIAHVKSSTSGPACGTIENLHCFIQISESDQEGPRRPEDEAQSWICFQPNGNLGPARPGKAHSGL